MKIVISALLLLFCLGAFSQIQNVNSYETLLKIQNDQKSDFQNVVVWGKFGWDSYKNICPNILNQSEYSGLLSGLGLKLFSDSTTQYFLPINKKAKIYTDFKEGDIIKLKVKLYRNCKFLEGKVFFLIEEIL